MAPPKPPRANVIIDSAMLDEERIPPWQRADPSEEPDAAARAARVFDRRDHRERGDQAGKHDRVGREGVYQLPAAFNAGIGELMVQANGRREQDELHEHHARERIAEQLAACEGRHQRVPRHVGGQSQKYVRGWPNHQKYVRATIGSMRSTSPTDHGRIRTTTSTARPVVARIQMMTVVIMPCMASGVRAPARGRLPPGAVARDHHAAPDPRTNDQQRGADIERGVRQQRRIERVEDGARAREDRDRRNHGADRRDPERRPRPCLADDTPQRRFGDEVTHRHDEERGEDQRQQHAMRGHRQVVHPRRSERQFDAGTGQRLHDRHHRAQPQTR